jgi:ribosomal protein S18 acetylase RimI-like enzyme
VTGLVPYAIESLGTQHDRAAFSCGVEALDRFFKQQAGQESRRHVANCFVGLHKTEKTIGGFYTLSATAVIFDDLPEEFRKKLPRYPEVPAALLGRLAVDLAHRRRGLGDFLLFDAMRRTLHADLAAAVLIVDVKDEQAASFYRRHQFLDIGPGRKRLFLPVSRIAMIFA